VVELKSRGDVEAWVNARPEATRHQDAVALASRAALRLLPNLGYEMGHRIPYSRIAQPFFDVCRANAAARVFAITKGSTPHFSYARRAAFSAGMVFPTYVDGAIFCARSAAFSATNLKEAAIGIDFAARKINTAWSSVSSDATQIERDGVEIAVKSPLYDQNWPSEEIASLWRDLNETLSKPNGSFKVWIDWYERILNGIPSSIEVEEAYVFLEPPDHWEQGPEVVNAAIAKRLKELEDQNLLESSKSEIEAGSGATIVVENNQARLKPVVDETDVTAANDPIAMQLHAELLKALPEFVDQARRYGNKEGWKGLDTTAQDYAELLQSGLAEIATNVARFWTLSSKVGTFINQDDDLRAGRASFAEALDPDVRRTLVNVLLTGAPLVRRFPTGLTLDEDYLRWNQPRDTTAIAITLIQNAKQQQVLHGPSADIIIDAHVVGAKEGIQATKSRSWAGRMSRAFVFAVFIGVSGGIATKIGEKAAEKSEMVRRFTEFLLSEEKRILELTEGLPPDLAAKIREILRRIREGQLPPPPSTTAI
jgi:hypothetical protein